MIYLTRSPNDADLIPLFGDTAIPVNNPYGDFGFFGYWYGGRLIRVIGDRKKVHDIAASVEDGRHLEQVQRARESGIEFVFMVIEGRYREGMDGQIQIEVNRKWRDLQATRDNPLPYFRLVDYLNEIDWYGGVRVVRTESPMETVRAVQRLYHLFSKPPEAHTALHLFHTSNHPATMGRPSLLRRVAKELPGIEWTRSETVDIHFQTVRRMVNASIPEWESLEGFGPVIARNVDRALGGQ